MELGNQEGKHNLISIELSQIKEMQKFTSSKGTFQSCNSLEIIPADLAYLCLFIE